MPKVGGHFEVTFAGWWCSDFSGGLEGVQKVFMHDPYSVPTQPHSGTTSSHLVNNGSFSSAWMSSLAMLTVMENQHRSKAAETNWFKVAVLKEHPGFEEGVASLQEAFVCGMWS